jgi:hypothetical protein
MGGCFKISRDSIDTRMKSFSTSTAARIWASSGSNFRTLPVFPALGCGVPSGFVVPTLTISPIQRADSENPMEKVETAEALSEICLPLLLTPMVASRTRKGSYPSSCAPVKPARCSECKSHTVKE